MFIRTVRKKYDNSTVNSGAYFARVSCRKFIGDRTGRGVLGGNHLLAARRYLLLSEWQATEKRRPVLYARSVQTPAHKNNTYPRKGRQHPKALILRSISPAGLLLQ